VIGDLAPLLAGGLGVILRKCSDDPGGDELSGAADCLRADGAAADRRYGADVTGLSGAGFSTMRACCRSPSAWLGFIGLGMLPNAIGANASIVVTGPAGLLATLLTPPL
jgi:hypothetical protein